MIKKLIVLSAALAVTACSSVTNEPVRISPLEYSISASKNDIYFAAVDCTLENISAPATSGQFFDYQDKESGRLSVAFNSSYVIAFSSVPLKTTMSIKASDNNLNIRFSSIQQYFDAIGWTSVNKQKDGSTSEPELIMKKMADTISSCIKERV
jgi:hypothetical protein